MKDTKEFLISEGCTSQEQVLARLFETMLAYLRHHAGDSWEWRTQPETEKARNGEWRAYARIEFT